MSLDFVGIAGVPSPPPLRLLVAYVSGQDLVSRRRLAAVRSLWSTMQLESSHWSLRCLVATGGHTVDAFAYHPDRVCPSVTLNTPDGYLDLGHKVKALLVWAATHLPAKFDFLLKTDMDTIVCFSMITGRLDALIRRFGTRDSIYLGHAETCSKIEHQPGAKFYDAHYIADLLGREDAPCYPPYMQGLGYVLSYNLVSLLASIASSLKVYTNEDMMVGTWLIGHSINRGHLIARQFTVTNYQTTISECFPFFFNHKAPAYVMRECTHFYAATGLCWRPVRTSMSKAAAIGPLPPKPDNVLAGLKAQAGGSQTRLAGFQSGPRAELAGSSAGFGSLNALHAATISASPAEHAVDSGSLARLQRLVTIGVKVITRLRNHVQFILHSIRLRYPDISIIIADDEYVGVAKDEWDRLMAVITDLNVSYLRLVPRVGLSAGRNALVEACTTPYIVLLDDDVFFTPATRLELLLSALESNPNTTVAAGSYIQYDSHAAHSGASVDVNDYSLLFTDEGEGVWRARAAAAASAVGTCQVVHATHNFFMARVATLQRYPWHPKLAIFEHEHFFLQLHRARQAVLSCPHVSAFHYRATNLRDNSYASNSLRFREREFARHFCHAFPDIKRLEAPFWLYDCQRGKLCPQWDMSLPCAVMEDPGAFTRDALPLEVAATAKPSPESPQHVVVLGEGGGGAEVLMGLLLRARSHLIWEEPFGWHFNGHVPDEILASLFASLLRCDLSAQQLLMLHTVAPPQGGTEQKGSAADGDEGLEGASTLSDRYSSAGLNATARRFCGPSMPSAIISTRFHSGLPRALAALPVRILLVVRHPADVVIARLQAKRVRGAPAWPECTPSTIAACAASLCSSMQRMLESVRGHPMVHLVRWEALGRRKQKMAARLLSQVGVRMNQSQLAEIMSDLDAEIRASKGLSERFPISPRSRYIVAQQCSAVISRLGYRSFAAAIPSTTSGSTQSQSFVQRADPSSSKTNGSQTNGAHAHQLLLAHVSLPLLVCPVRLAGAEVVMRFFIKRDCPAATAAPLCFPEGGGDRCPSRHGAKWQRARWGPYPFAVVGASQVAPSTTVVVFVRNPWDRLVSAFTHYIEVQDRTSSTHRSWIREFYSLGERDQIQFSHFVRWVAQQDPAAMHRAWQPCTVTCLFQGAQRPLVLRLEQLQSDFKRLLRHLHLGQSDERLAETIIAKQRPADPIDGIDRQLRLLHYYLTDDAYDLVEVARRTYKEDIELFGYTFPSNESLTFGHAAHHIPK